MEGLPAMISRGLIAKNVVSLAAVSSLLGFCPHAATAEVTAEVASAESVYRLDASTTTGLDLTAMEGYYHDRMEGPLSANVDFSGPLTVDPSVSAENPFQLIGNGYRIYLRATGTGFHALPLKMYNAPGKTGGTRLMFPSASGGVYSGASLDIGKYNMVYFDINPGHVESGRVNIHDGGSIQGSVLNFGRNTQSAVSVTSGASINGTQGVRFGFQSAAVETPVSAFVGITNATVTAGGSDPASGKAFSLLYNSANANESGRVVIGPGGVVSANCISHHGAGSSRIVFDGGTYKSASSSSIPLFHVYGYTYSYSWVSPVMTVEGVNGNAIDVEIAYGRNLAGGESGAYRKINLTGSGGFTKRGAGTLYFNRKDHSSGTSVCDYTGPTKILGGGIVVSNASFKVGRGELSLSTGTFLDLNGFDVEFVGASGDGEIRNSSATTATLLLGYGDGSGDFDAAVVGSVAVVKAGVGTLTFKARAADYAGDLTISGGTVKVASGVAATNLCAVTVEKGATLDLRGATFRCRSLVKRGTLLVDGDTVIVVGGDEDATYGGFSLPGGIVKEGSGDFTLYADGSSDSDVAVKAGRLVCRPLTYPGKYFKVNVFKTTTTNNTYHLYNAEFSLFDVDGNRINEHEWTYNAKPGEGYSKTYGGLADASGLAEWEVALAGVNCYYDHPEGQGPNKAMDGNTATQFDQLSWWQNNAFMFRLPSTAADASGFLFTTHATAQNSLPAQWKIYGSMDGMDWTLLADNSVDWTDDEAREAAVNAVPKTTSTDYNNGVPFAFDVYGWTSGAPFGAGVVSVAEGATLDLSSSSMQIARLSVSSSVPSGTITRFTPTVGGELILDSLPAGLDFANVQLPITVGTVGSPENLNTWRVVVGGVTMDGVGVRHRNGSIVLVKARGFMLIFK